MKNILVLILVFWVFTLPVKAQLAKGRQKFLGNIIGRVVPEDFAQYWNQVSPENAGKWGSVEAKRDQMNWEGLKLVYQFAKTHKLSFKQHTFVWDQQRPLWMDSLSPKEQKEEVEEWIKAFAENFPEADFIDVVNEPLHAPASYRETLGGAGATGWDWVIWAFQKARFYCPKAKLLLNDYNILSSDSATQVYLGIIKTLQSEKLIDGIGLQGHFLEQTPLNTIRGNLDKLHTTGLPIFISEFDVQFTDDAAQKNKFESLFKTFWEHPGVQGITLWGYLEGRIWRKDAYLIRKDGSKRPAMLWLEGYLKK